MEQVRWTRLRSSPFLAHSFQIEALRGCDCTVKGGEGNGDGITKVVPDPDRLNVSSRLSRPETATRLRPEWKSHRSGFEVIALCWRMGVLKRSDRRPLVLVAALRDAFIDCRWGTVVSLALATSTGGDQASPVFR